MHALPLAMISFEFSAMPCLFIFYQYYTLFSISVIFRRFEILFSRYFRKYFNDYASIKVLLARQHDFAVWWLGGIGIYLALCPSGICFRRGKFFEEVVKINFRSLPELLKNMHIYINNYIENNTSQGQITRCVTFSNYFLSWLEASLFFRDPLRND